MDNERSRKKLLAPSASACETSYVLNISRSIEQLIKIGTDQSIETVSLDREFGEFVAGLSNEKKDEY